MERTAAHHVDMSYTNKYLEASFSFVASLDTFSSKHRKEGFLND
jgi:hypothetical protein